MPDPRRSSHNKEESVSRATGSHRTKGVALLGLTAVATLAGTGMAEAATKTVEAGPFGKKAQRAFQGASADANAFFRRVITIRRGDSVSWDINGFHTVTFVPRGTARPSLIAPDPANPVSGVLDAANEPFWFNGQPRLTVNPTAMMPSGGSTFDREKLHNSGLPAGEGPPKPYKLKFNRTGRFRYICLVHPGMHATVRVLKRRSSGPSAKVDRRQAKREQRILLRRAQRRTSGVGASLPANTAQAGNDDRDGTAIFKFFPADLKVKAGATVALRMSPRTTEDHTFTFGPINGKDAYVDQIAANFISPVGGGDGPPTLVIDPRAAYPSETPGQGVASVGPTIHGNGFFNTGVMDRNRSTPPPATVRVTFTTPGTYRYLCAIHPFMHGQVTVEP
jgi:plastocyanin